MTSKATYDLLEAYYRAFNDADVDKFIATLHPEVIHDICEGPTEVGRDAFRKFMEWCFAAAKETVRDLIIITSEDGEYASAKLTVDGVYLDDMGNYPPAKKQKYTLPVYGFFEIKDNLIYRMSCFYNQKNWLAQVQQKEVPSAPHAGVP